MNTNPVQFRVEPARMDRLQVLVRVVFLALLAAIGCSWGYWALYLGVPAAVALVLSQKGADPYLREDAPRMLRVLRWIAGLYAYLWLLTDALPSSDPAGPVDFEVQPGGDPSPGSALARVIMSLPALVMLAILSLVAAVLWVLGALAILATERLPPFIHEFIAMKLRYQMRLVAYHLSLVDVYPYIGETPQSHAPHSGSA